MNEVQERSDSSHRTSATLLEKVRHRDPEAWRRLVDVYAPLVFHWGKRWGLADEDAGDLLQDVLFAVALGVERFQADDDRGRFRGWLWTIARNKFCDHRRRRGIVESAYGGSEMCDKLAATPEEWSDDSSDMTRAESKALFHRGLRLVQAEFEPRTWEAFWRVVVDGQAVPEVAATLGLSPASVRQAKSRVLRRLRVELGDA